MPPDRQLRRMVVDLAALHGDDVAAVLEQLDPEQRRKVETLLKEFSAFGFGDAAASSPSIDTARVSSWLIERTVASASMTASARAALLRCATQLYPAPPSAKRARPTLFARFKPRRGPVA
jgi:hypothetical protein